MSDLDSEKYRRLQCPHCKVTGGHIRTFARFREADGTERHAWMCLQCSSYQLEPLPDAAKSEEWAQHKARL